MKQLAGAALALSMLSPLGAAEAELQISRAGTRPVNAAPAQNFTGSVQVEMLHAPAAPARTSAGTVSFAAGARTAWHTHPLGQTLVVTSGIGRVQRWGGPAQEIKAGDVVHIPAGVRHWHGAAPTHRDDAHRHHRGSGRQDRGLAGAGHGRAIRTRRNPLLRSAPAQPSRAQQLLGDVAPKLAQLTDDVLFGDVWARPGLSPRDRSLVTVSALIAMNRPDQLRSHMSLARTNGVSKDELVETLTHLAFYSGWPNAVTAAGVAREVFANKP